MLGYVLSTIIYGLLLTGSVTAWRRRLAGSGLAAAVAIQLGWSVILAARTVGAPVGLVVLVAAEYLRCLAWIIVLARCLSAAESARRPRLVLRLVSALTAAVVVAAGGLLIAGSPPALTRILAAHWLWGGLILSVAGLILVEQVARNTRSGQLWNLKYVWLAIGALFTWELCVYSIILLHGSAAPNFWLARGFVSALVGGVLAVGLRRIPSWHSSEFLAPRLVFFNAALLGTAAYVLAMSAASYVLLELGGSWGAAWQAVLLVGGTVLLAVAVLSEQFRAWVRVVLAKNLFPYTYDYRSEWQKLTRALSESGDAPLYERVSTVMAQSVHCGGGGLWLRDSEGVFVPVGGKLAPVDAPREPAARTFFEYLREHDWICDLDDARGPVGDASGGTPRPPEWMLANAKLWLVVPLICERTLIGFVVLGQPLAPLRLSWEELDLLHAAGRQVASFLAFEQAAKRLAEAQQFDALNRLSAFLMHDLRHLIAQQALVVENAARHRGNPEFFDDAILTIDNSVQRMSRLMAELREGVLTEQTQRVDLSELGAEIVRRAGARHPVPLLEVQDRQVEVVVNRERMLRVLEHVVRNAQDATSDSGMTQVSVRKVGQRAVVDVVDDGVGMDADFIRDRLFKPFTTTKGERGMGIGAYEAREYVRKWGGNIHVDSVVGRGTTFSINLPLAPSLDTVETAAVHEFQTP